jgi:[glutamine synthetase] adenylyltransferase / [glutamine synthetase]-adenylyl-L-tyrosine phosphorylase
MNRNSKRISRRFCRAAALRMLRGSSICMIRFFTDGVPMNPGKPNIPSEIINDAISRWKTYTLAAEAHAAVIEADQVFFEELLHVWEFSEFIPKICLRNPDILMDLFESKHLFEVYPIDFYRKYLNLALTDFDHGSTTGLTNADLANQIPVLQRLLRNFRQREMVRIAWRDLSGRAGLVETMADLSAFADACIDCSLSVLYNLHCCVDGVPRAKNGSRQYLTVFGLGKLGGKELNFSSDVDLILAYPEAGETDHPEKPLSNDAFFVRLSRNLIKTLSEITPDGQVFRVDMRLRPDGENGPLVMSFENTEEYYQFHGREWERYAWIKARPVAGDMTAAENLLKRLKPFIYRRYLDYGAFDSLRDMKQKISIEVKRKGLANNIKMGPGGIREIEFFGQVFQLIRGGIIPGLQDQRILHILDTLVDENYIEPKTRDELRASYCFLRNTEHRLQEFSDRQTHDLPDKPRARLQLALAMGFDDWTAFYSRLKQHTDIAHRHFSNLLASRQSETKTNCSNENTQEIACLWTGSNVDEQTGLELSNAGFKAPEDIKKLLNQFKNSPRTRSLSREGRAKIDRLIPIILKSTSRSPQPDLVLKRLIALVETIQRRTNYVSLLLENPGALEHLIRLANASPWIITFLARHPVLLDELIDPRTLYAPPEKDALRENLSRRLSKVESDDLEYQIETLCIFRQVNELRVAAADITDVLPLMRVSDHLSDIAETILEKVISLSWQHLITKHGRPSASLKGNPCEKGFAVIAYGKLGGLELGYGSDLDMVFIHAGDKGQTGGDRPIENSQFYTRLGQRVVHLLTTHTAAGRIYEVDMRLRPSGSSGMLVSHFTSFQAYQSQDAWTWEHQALLRTRAIIGDRHLTDWFNRVREDILTRKRDKKALQKEVLSMREKMRSTLTQKDSGSFDLKQDRGGMVDIEFLVQFLVLLNAHKFNKLVTYPDNVRQIQALSETGILDEKVAHLLRRIYLVYRATVHRLNLSEKSHTVPIDTFQDLRQHIEKIWSFYLNQ